MFIGPKFDFSEYADLLTSEETRFILFMYKDSRILYPHCKYHNPYIILKYSIRLQ